MGFLKRNLLASLRVQKLHLSRLHMRMLQNTHLVIGLLLGWNAFVVNAGKSVSECETREYKKCFGVYMDVYRNADKTQSLLDIHCKSSEDIGKCLISNLGCSGEFIDEFRFIVLQHMIVDDKLGVCVHPVLSRFEQVFHDKDEYLTKIAGWKDLEADKFAPCAAKTSRYCDTQLAKEFMNNKKTCRDITHFIDCYESVPCSDKIYKDLVTDMEISRKNLIYKYLRNMPKATAGC